MLLISSPAKAWEEIRLEEDRRKVFTAFVYPMIGLCGLSVFIGSLLAKGWGGPESFQYAMTQCCAVAVSLFGGYFLAAYLINGMRVKMFMMDSDTLMKVEEKDRLRFTIISSILLIACPMLIQFIFNKLTMVLN